VVAHAVKVVVGIDSEVAKHDWLIEGVIVREWYGVCTGFEWPKNSMCC